MNTISEDLDLTKGAVSKAILTVAGPMLQQLVNAQDARGLIGEVITTGSCNLRCKQVYHTVAPGWDKDKGTSKKVKYLIFHYA